MTEGTTTGTTCAAAPVTPKAKHTLAASASTGSMAVYRARGWRRAAAPAAAAAAVTSSSFHVFLLVEIVEEYLTELH